MRFVLTVGLAIVSVSLFSQELKRGAIAGRVLDKVTKEPIAGATARVLGTELGAVADADGKFTIQNIPVGTYQIKVSAVGYESAIRSDVVVSTARPFVVVVELQEKSVEGKEVEVVADYFKKRKADSPTSEQNFSYEEIRRLPGGFEDVVRAVSTLPGVSVASAGRNDLLVRGGAPSENLFLIDGIEVPNINHFGTQGFGGGPIAFVNLDYVREVNFSTGGFGVKYGDKISSVVSLELRNGREDRIGGKLNLSATQFGFNIESPISEKGQYFFSARRSYLDFIFKAAGFSFVPEYYDFLGKATYNLGGGNEISALGIGVIDNVRLFNDTPDQRFNNSRLLDNTQYQLIGGVSWKKVFKGGFVSTTLGRTRIDYRFQQRDSLQNPFFRNNSIEDELNLRSDATISIGKETELSFGAQAKTIGFDADVFLKAQNANIVLVEKKLNDRFYKGALYGQVLQRFGRLTATLGGRVDYFDGVNKKFYPAPRGSFSFALTDKTTLNASAGRYAQAPSYIWLVAEEANRNLKNIQTNVFVAGFEQIAQPDLKFSVEAYFKDYRDYPASLSRTFLTLANTGADFGGSEDGFASFGLEPLASLGRGRAYGVEFFVQKKLSETPYYGIASLTIGKSEFRGADGKFRPSNFDQRIIFSLSGGYRFDEKWELGVKFRYASGRPFTPVGANGDPSYGFRLTNLDPNAFNSRRLPDFHALDIRVDRRWQFSSWTLITYLDVQNVYNRRNENPPRWNPRENKVERAGGQIGLLPSIGVNAEF
ncbi:MAG: TonB-dependent receptor [Chloroherpetonaceae bacterium]|nr:TonB-dependent receptor [Chloroherpetonaceae bacterium]MDW8437255.1 TonB-dependent receptor [Chloroherpetonaceae bacterium]